ncbi:MAG TPA: hypothetical protein VFP70_09530 [Burkholderiales bacterium]|nr:hypothetical protein [Burkholderiales bacterium]
MSEYVKWWEQRLRMAGVAATTITVVMRDHSRHWGGDTPRVEVDYDKARQREQIRALRLSGIPARTARFKVRGY